MRQQIGRYQIKELLGSGSFGDVYLGLDPVLERHAAIKVLDPVIAREREAVERFYQEARVLAKLQHPRIAGVW
jgi:serine/threonine protein kinase